MLWFIGAWCTQGKKHNRDCSLIIKLLLISTMISPPIVFMIWQVTSKTPSAPTDRHPSGVDTSSVSDPALSMPQLVRVCSPPPPTSVEVKRPPALSPVPRLPSPPSLAPQGANDSLVKSVSAHLSNHLIPLNRAVEKQIPSQGPIDSLVKSVVAAHLSNRLIPLNKAIEKQIPSHSHTVPGASPKTGPAITLVYIFVVLVDFNVATTRTAIHPCLSFCMCSHSLKEKSSMYQSIALLVEVTVCL